MLDYSSSLQSAYELVTNPLVKDLEWAPYLSCMITYPQRLRDMASEIRSIAEITKQPKVRQQLSDVAEQLELVARRREHPSKTKPKTKPPEENGRG